MSLALGRAHGASVAGFCPSALPAPARRLISRPLGAPAPFQVPEILFLRNALIASLSTIIVPGGAVVLVPYLILQATGVSSIAQVGPMEIGSLILGLIGLSMVVWVSVAFVTQGKGTPAPIEPPKNFVAAGLYRFLRNPMYFGALLTVFAEALFFRSTWLLLYGAILWLALHIPTVLFEEPQLERRFGDSYRQYKARTPRWIPRRPRS